MFIVTHHQKSFFVRFLLLMLILSCTTGCRCGCFPFCFKPFCHIPDGRRPPVATYEQQTVIDYSFDDDDDDEEEDEDKSRLPPELLDRNKPILDEYRIAIGDVLEISVFGDEDTHIDNVVVAPDGRIYYLFMDGMIAEGKTPEILRKELEKSLADMFLAPTVSIIPREMTKNTFTVLGRVRHPGVYALTQAFSIRQAIGLAGGLMLEPELVNSSDQGNRFFVQSSRNGFFIEPYTGTNQNVTSLRNSFLIREGKKLNIDFEHLVYSGDLSQDVILKPGDYLYIASDDSREVYVLGNVAAPTAVTYQDNMTVMKALANAGGWRSGGPFGADIHNVLVLRGALDHPQVVRLDLSKLITGEARDMHLQPGDIVYVHNKKFRFGRELVQLAISGFISSFMNDAGIYFADRHFSHSTGP